MATQVVTLKQDCRVETWRHEQKLTEGFAKAGEQIKLFHDNGFRTVVYSVNQYEDRYKWQLDGDFEAYERYYAGNYGELY